MRQGQSEMTSCRGRGRRRRKGEDAPGKPLPLLEARPAPPLAGTGAPFGSHPSGTSSSTGRGSLHQRCRPCAAPACEVRRGKAVVSVTWPPRLRASSPRGSGSTGSDAQLLLVHLASELPREHLEAQLSRSIDELENGHVGSVANAAARQVDPGVAAGSLDVALAQDRVQRRHRHPVIEEPRLGRAKRLWRSLPGRGDHLRGARAKSKEGSGPLDQLELETETEKRGRVDAGATWAETEIDSMMNGGRTFSSTFLAALALATVVSICPCSMTEETSPLRQRRGREEGQRALWLTQRRPGSGASASGGQTGEAS
jgi:hypothetical protein